MPSPVIAEFADPRLVAIYESVNAYEPGSQPRFYSEIASEMGAVSIVDVGCGTGLITRDLAAQGYRMTGVDPAPAMLEVARRRPYGDRVRWIDGDVSRLESFDADLAIMTGHVAQFFVDDESWSTALTSLRAALRPGGALAFECRNPDAREWEQWTSANRVRVQDPAAGPIETWTEVDEVADGVVSYTNHYVFLRDGQELVSAGRLRFRRETEVRQSLAEGGFTVDRTYGDWDRRPAGPATRELIVIAFP